MSKICHPEDLTQEEFATLMENDPVFRREMLRRQAAAVERIEASHREMKDRRKTPSFDTKVHYSSLSKETILYGGGCSTNFIKTAPIHELQRAVRENRLSASRFRIEMKRRRNRDYYDFMPDKTYEYLSTP